MTNSTFSDALDSLVSSQHATTRLPSSSSSRASSSGSGAGTAGRAYRDGPPTGYAPNYDPPAPSALLSEVLSIPAAAPAERLSRGSSGGTGGNVPPAVGGEPSGSDSAANEPHGVLASSPCGQHLQLDILSTWGDPYYVGLSALEVFDECGHPIVVDEHRGVSADPADINVLPEYGHDVRVVSNLFDGTFRTCDDAHLWLAPFTPGQRNFVYVDLGGLRTISMVRVWNYNKSRIHSFRGARMIELRLDGSLIFRGEVNKAPGCLHEVEKAAEPILFTMDPDVLRTIDEHDQQLFEYEPVAELPSAARERPPTAERHLQQQPSSQRALRPAEEDVPEAVRSALSRPRTAAFDAMMASCNAGMQQRNELGQHEAALLSGVAGAASGASAAGVPTVSMLQDYMTHVHPAGRVVTLVLVSTWGDPHYVGLNGVQLLTPSGSPLRIEPTQLSADPPSIASLRSTANDPRTVDKLVDGTNATCARVERKLPSLAPCATARVLVACPLTRRLPRAPATCAGTTTGTCSWPLSRRGAPTWCGSTSERATSCGARRWRPGRTPRIGKSPSATAARCWPGGGCWSPPRTAV